MFYAVTGLFRQARTETGQSGKNPRGTSWTLRPCTGLRGTRQADFRLEPTDESRSHFDRAPAAFFSLRYAVVLSRYPQGVLDNLAWRLPGAGDRFECCGESWGSVICHPRAREASYRLKIQRRYRWCG